MPFIEQPLTIWTAARKGLLAEVQRFVTEGAPVNAADRGNVTPLHEAAAEGHTTLVAWLLDNNADVNCRTETQRGYPGAETPLYMAVDRNQLETVRLLLVKGANPNLKSSDGTSALDCAAFSGNMDLVALLVENGASVNGRGDSNPLLMALNGRHLDVARYLVKRGAKSNSKIPPFGASLLNFTGGCKWVAGIDFLLSLGLDVNEQDKEGNTALHNAVISYGTRVSQTIKTKSGEKLVVVEKPEDALPVVKRLLETGALATTKNKGGLSPLDYATKMRAQVLVDLLSSTKAS